MNHFPIYLVRIESPVLKCCKHHWFYYW